jgi:hypothetical protein
MRRLVVRVPADTVPADHEYPVAFSQMVCASMAFTESQIEQFKFVQRISVSNFLWNN